MAEDRLGARPPDSPPPGPEPSQPPCPLPPLLLRLSPSPSVCRAPRSASRTSCTASTGWGTPTRRFRTARRWPRRPPSSSPTRPESTQDRRVHIYIFIFIFIFRDASRPSSFLRRCSSSPTRPRAGAFFFFPPPPPLASIFLFYWRRHSSSELKLTVFAFIELNLKVSVNQWIE